MVYQISRLGKAQQTALPCQAAAEASAAGEGAADDLACRIARQGLQLEHLLRALVGIWMNWHKYARRYCLWLVTKTRDAWKPRSCSSEPSARQGLAIPQTGHTANLEEPDTFNWVVDRFLAAVERRAWRPRDPR